MHFKFYQANLLAKSNTIMKGNQETKPSLLGGTISSKLKTNEEEELKAEIDHHHPVKELLSEEQMIKIFSFENFQKMHNDIAEIKTHLKKQEWKAFCNYSLLVIDSNSLRIP